MTVVVGVAIAVAVADVGVISAWAASNDRISDGFRCRVSCSITCVVVSTDIAANAAWVAWIARAAADNAATSSSAASGDDDIKG